MKDSVQKLKEKCPWFFKEKSPIKYTECDKIGHMWTWMPKNKHLCMRCGIMEEK